MKRVCSIRKTKIKKTLKKHKKENLAFSLNKKIKKKNDNYCMNYKGYSGLSKRKKKKEKS